MEGHYQQVVVTSNACSNLITLVVVLYIWAMPGPSSGCFVMTKSVRQHKIVKSGKLQKSESSLNYVVFGEGSTNALPVFTSVFAYLAFSFRAQQECLYSVSDQ